MQSYHTNAKTNIAIREEIQANSFSSSKELAKRFMTSTKTILKWKTRTYTQDKSSRPLNIKYGLSELEETLATSIRQATWFSLDEVWEMVLVQNKDVKRSSVYSCFVRNNINKIPQKEKDKAKKFKAYEPGYLHFDVTYLPKLNGHKYYLYVAIDRATRAMFYEIYEDKTADSTEDFFDKCMSFFPFEITHILTDNGLEFTNKLIKSKKGILCQKPSKLDIKCEQHNIQHRLTQPSTPQTNGMVERVNGTIKNNTILKNKYATITELSSDLMAFLIYYNIHRRHGSLRKELNVKTPIQAIEKWHELKPELFKNNSQEFKNKLLNLHQNNAVFNQQRYQT